MQAEQVLYEAHTVADPVGAGQMLGLAETAIKRARNRHNFIGNGFLDALS